MMSFISHSSWWARTTAFSLTCLGVPICQGAVISPRVICDCCNQPIASQKHRLKLERITLSSGQIIDIYKETKVLNTHTNTYTLVIEFVARIDFDSNLDWNQFFTSAWSSLCRRAEIQAAPNVLLRAVERTLLRNEPARSVSKVYKRDLNGIWRATPSDDQTPYLTPY